MLRTLEDVFQEFFNSKYLAGDHLENLQEIQKVVDDYTEFLIPRVSKHPITKDTPLDHAYVLFYLLEVLISWHGFLKLTKIFPTEDLDKIQERITTLESLYQENKEIITDFCQYTYFCFLGNIFKSADIKGKITENISDEEIKEIFNNYLKENPLFLKEVHNKNVSHILDEYHEYYEAIPQRSSASFQKEFKVFQALYGELPSFSNNTLPNVPACSTIHVQFYSPKNMVFKSTWDTYVCVSWDTYLCETYVCNSYYEAKLYQQAINVYKVANNASNDVWDIHNPFIFKMFFNALLFRDPFYVWQMRTLMKLTFPAHMHYKDFISYKELLLEFIELHQSREIPLRSLSFSPQITNHLLLDLIGKIENKDIDDIIKEPSNPVINALLSTMLINERYIQNERYKKSGNQIPDSLKSNILDKDIYKQCAEFIGIPNAFEKLNSAPIDSSLVKIIRYTQMGNDGLVMIINLLYEIINHQLPVEKNDTDNVKVKQQKRAEFEQSIKITYKNQEINTYFSRQSLFAFDDENCPKYMEFYEKRLNAIVLVDIRHITTHFLGEIRDIETIIDPKKIANLINTLKYYRNSDDIPKSKELREECSKIIKRLEKLTVIKGTGCPETEGTETVPEKYLDLLKDRLTPFLRQIFRVDDNERVLHENRFELIIYFLYLFINLPEKS